MLNKASILFILLLISKLCFAGTDLKKTVEFIAFSEDGETYLLKVTDANMGDVFMVKNINTGNKITQMQITTKDQEPVLLKKLENKYKLKNKGHQGNSSPDGKYTIMGAKNDEIFKLMIMQGEKITNFQNIQLKKDGDKIAEAVLKQVIWSSEAEYVIIILHQKLVSSWGIDADFDYPFEFRRSALQFK